VNRKSTSFFTKKSAPPEEAKSPSFLGVVAPAEQMLPFSRSFLLLFFKKEALAYFRGP
jgi:hypothetical protein